MAPYQNKAASKTCYTDEFHFFSTVMRYVRCFYFTLTSYTENRADEPAPRSPQPRKHEAPRPASTLLTLTLCQYCYSTKPWRNEM